MNDLIYRLPRVRQITGLSRSTIYERIPKGTFPKQIRIGSNSVGWLASEIESWIDERVKDS
ncbi:MAG: AlpA family transcriptional regulator, partial [Cytophagales bacterium]|nr:AlpA family transcriptional regulator [Cytophagales bacterium]